MGGERKKNHLSHISSGFFSSDHPRHFNMLSSIYAEDKGCRSTILLPVFAYIYALHSCDIQLLIESKIYPCHHHYYTKCFQVRSNIFSHAELQPVWSNSSAKIAICACVRRNCTRKSDFRVLVLMSPTCKNKKSKKKLKK